MGLSNHHTPGEAVYFTVSFHLDGKDYNGRLTPEYKNGNDHASSWHVVLNDVFFGYLHKEGNHWKVSEQRPDNLAQKVGDLIDHKNYQPKSI